MASASRVRRILEERIELLEQRVADLETAAAQKPAKRATAANNAAAPPAT
jgi:hypothetical protein